VQPGFFQCFSPKYYAFIYLCSARGRERTGIPEHLEAQSEQAAIAALLNRNLLVVSIQEKLGKKGKTSGGSVALQDLVVFTRQLATMVDAGLAMVQSLQALAEQTPNKVMRDVIKDVCSRVDGGDSFSEALQKHPKVFNRLYFSMVAAGERGGLLAEILSRLATYLENAARLRKKVKSAMMYPIVVTIIAIGITIFLLVKVVPVFAEVYRGFGQKLPGPTLALITLSNFVKSYILIILPAMAGLVYGWLAYIKSKPGREFWDRVRIKLPIFGHIAHKICLARFSRTLASLIRFKDPSARRSAWRRPAPIPGISSRTDWKFLWKDHNSVPRLQKAEKQISGNVSAVLLWRPGSAAIQGYVHHESGRSEKLLF
jgi:type IV pilus assembly protein PilC